MRGYPGSKGASGVAQRIISLMPRHDLYVEPFLGGGLVLERKRPAVASLAADLDADLIRYHRRSPLPGVEYLIGDAFKLLEQIPMHRGVLVYLDPPYHPDSRTKKKIYKFELSAEQHAALLFIAKGLKANVMISGYRCPLYDVQLERWHREDFTGMTRGGPKTESVWCNFAPGETYHDTRFLGGDYRERERIKRKRSRWLSRFVKMDGAERAVIFEALEAASIAATAAVGGGSSSAPRSRTAGNDVRIRTQGE